MTVIGERLRPWQLAGVVLVSVGLASLALGGRRPARRRDRAVIAFALGTGAFIAAHTVTNGLGVRHAGTVGTMLLGERFGRLRVVAATLVAAEILLLNLP